jgi:hypothetical protein
LSPVAKHIGSALRALGPPMGALLETLLLLAGAALISYGAWEAWKPAGPIVGGILLIAGVILRARGNG